MFTPIFNNTRTFATHFSQLPRTWPRLVCYFFLFPPDPNVSCFLCRLFCISCPSLFDPALFAKLPTFVPKHASSRRLFLYTQPSSQSPLTQSFSKAIFSTMPQPSRNLFVLPSASVCLTLSHYLPRLEGVKIQDRRARSNMTRTAYRMYKKHTFRSSTTLIYSQPKLKV